MATTRIQMTLNLGPDAPIEVVSGAIAHLNTICQFAGALEERVVRLQSLGAIIAADSGWFSEEVQDALQRNRHLRLGPDVYPGKRYREYFEVRMVELAAQQALSPDLDAIVGRFIQESNLEDAGDVTVESLTYRNPIELVVGVSGYLLLELLLILRDWKTNRRMGNAAAEDYEDQVRSKKVLRRIFEQQLVAGQQHITTEMIDSLYDDKVATAFREVGGSRFQYRELGGDDSSQEA